MESGHEAMGLLVRVGFRLAAELDEQPAFPWGKKRQIVQVEPFDAHVVDEHLIQRLAADGAGRHA